MPTPSELFLSILFSLVGFAYIAVGRKTSFYFVLAGICLVLLTFFSLGTWTFILLGLGIAIIPFILQKYLD